MEGIQGDAKGLTRREALKRGIAIGSLVWAVPLVQAVGMRPAYAHNTSGGCLQSCLRWWPGRPGVGVMCPKGPESETDSLESSAKTLDAGPYSYDGDWELVTFQHPDISESEIAPEDTLGNSSKGTTSLEDTTPAEGGDSTASGDAGPEGILESTTTTTEKLSTQEHHGSPPPPARCLDCPPDALHYLPRNLRRLVQVYGSPAFGLTFLFPASWTLANVENPVGVTCSVNHATECSHVYQLASSPCDPSLSGFTVRPCSTGATILHVGMVLDICE